MTTIKRLVKCLQIISVLAVIAIIIGLPSRTLAAQATINTGPKVTFTFDDGLASTYTNAAPILAKYGLSGTDYVITGCVGMTTTPNTCRANTDTTYMTWQQIQALQNTYGWEIGSHTVDHDCLVTSAAQDPEDCQANTLTPAQVTAELTDSKAALAAHGLNVTDLSTPYGDYNQSVLALIAKYYASQRGFADTGLNSAPYNDYIIRDQHIEGRTSVATVESYINQAIANRQWLVLTFHNILPRASNNPDDYEYSTAKLDQIAAYVKSKNVAVVNINAGLISGTNLMPNPSFDSGLTGWSTDAPGNVVLDGGDNGSYPSPANSVALTASANQTAHLFSPKISINPNATYILKSYLNLIKINLNSSIGYYVDEYDANGNWISGQYKQSVSYAWPQTAGFEYKPSSLNVAKASLQVIVPAGSGVQAYVDNFQWLDENPAALPPPTQTNLVPNGAFDDGIADGWTTDAPATIVADNGNNGSPANPVNSVKMTAATANTHLFSPKVSVDPTKTYSLSTYVNVTQLTSGEIGFYVDEYDANGNWISGKYVTGMRSVGTGTVAFSYTPTSASVKTASLQIICVGNSGIVAYVDNVVWTQN